MPVTARLVCNWKRQMEAAPSMSTVPSTRTVPLFSIVLAAACTLSPRRARAEELLGQPRTSRTTAAVSDPRVLQLGTLLQRGSSESSRHQTWEAITNLTVGAAGIPAGVFELNRGATGVSFLFFGTSALSLTTGVVGLARTSSGESVYASYLARRGRMSDEALIAATEEDWQQAAHDARAARTRAGIFYGSVGFILVALGATSASANCCFPSANTATNDRAMFATLMMSLGGAFALGGVQSLLIRDPLESSWEDYSMLREGAAPRPGSVALAPIALQGGAGFGASGTW